MFKKKPNIKPLSPLRSSDRRKTADQIISALGLEVPLGDDASPEDKAAATAQHTSLRNSLLPENTQSARFTTTSGPDLKQVSGTLYVGSHPDEEQRVLWVKTEDLMYPTVYTLWHNPGMVPLLHTPSIVVQKIQGGADLMTPGLARGPPFPRKATKGALVAVASTEAATVPMAVGICEIDISGLQQTQGAKGRAVQILHWQGDELFAWSASGKPPGAVPTWLDGWEGDAEREASLVTGMEGVSVEDSEGAGGVSLRDVATATGKSRDRGDTAKESASREHDGTEVNPASEHEDAEDERELTTKEIDEAFRNAFLYGVHHYKATHQGQPNFGLQFPLSQSFVMSNLVQPFLPAFTPAQANSLQMKKTSWKNIKKFIRSLDKAQIIKSKERDGNEVVIFDIDFDDQHIVNFTPYRLPKKETSAGTSQGRGDKATTVADANDDSVGQKLKRLELYRPKEKLSPIFSTANADPRGYYTTAEIRPIVTSYIEAEKLIPPTNKRLVTLNPVLSNAVFDGSAPLDQEVVAKGSVPRDALIDRIVKACAPFWCILRNGEELQHGSAAGKPRAGAAPRVAVTLETRRGDKTVTKVSGLEAFFIMPQPLADELRKTCAGSTSVERLAGSSPKNPVMEVMIQGPQKEAVLKALERRGVHKNWVEVVDKTKDKRK